MTSFMGDKDASHGSPVDAVIFDYGEVLCFKQPAGTLSEIRSVSGLDDASFNQHYWGQRDHYDGGRYSGVHYWQAIAQAARVPLSHEQIEKLISLDIASWSTLDPVMLDWARRLQEHGVKTAILSNMQPDLLRHMQSQFQWLSGFTHLTFSCNLGMLKPAPEIYRECLAGLNTTASRTLFLDDRQVNVEGARKAGMRAILFQSPEQLARDVAAIPGLPPVLPARQTTGQES